MVPGPPASLTGPQGRVEEPKRPGQRAAAALMGSSLGSLSQGSKSGVHPVCHMGGLRLASRQACPAQETARVGCSGKHNH